MGEAASLALPSRYSECEFTAPTSLCVFCGRIALEVKIPYSFSSPTKKL